MADVTISYNNADIVELSDNDEIILDTAGKSMADDITVKYVKPVPRDANLVAGNIKKDASIFGVTGTYEGSGGGSSDFTTCTVTFIEQWDEYWIIYVPWINDYGSTGDMNAVIYLGAGQTVTVQCVLYKGLAVGSFPDDSRPSTGTITTTGGVSYDEDANFINITGDGTLTIG